MWVDSSYSIIAGGVTVFCVAAIGEFKATKEGEARACAPGLLALRLSQ
jgi:hypothetical protein